MEADKEDGRMRRRTEADEEDGRMRRRRRMGRRRMDEEAAYTEKDGGTRRRHNTRRMDVAYEDEDGEGVRGGGCRCEEAGEMEV